MMKARVTSQKGAIKQYFAATHVDFAIDDPEDLSEEEVTHKLLACGGAHKPKYYDFGGASGEAAKNVRRHTHTYAHAHALPWALLFLFFFFCCVRHFALLYAPDENELMHGWVGTPPFLFFIYFLKSEPIRTEYDRMLIDSSSSFSIPRKQQDKR